MKRDPDSIGSNMLAKKAATSLAWRFFSYLKSFVARQEVHPLLVPPTGDSRPIESLPQDLLAIIMNKASEGEPFVPALAEVNRSFRLAYNRALLPKGENATKFFKETLIPQQQVKIDYMLANKEAILVKAKQCERVMKCFEKLEECNQRQKQIGADDAIIFRIREEVLNQLNAAIIRQQIDKTSTRLDCSGCHLTAFPEIKDPELEEYWATLHILDLNDNLLTTFPESIVQFGALQRLFIEENRLTAVPATIEQLVALQELDLSDNQLADLPAGVWRIVALRGLYVCRNQLMSIPQQIGQLERLEHLQLDHNQLTALPEAIGQLEALQMLYLDHNQLIDLPPEIREEILFTYEMDAQRNVVNKRSTTRAETLANQNSPATDQDRAAKRQKFG